MRIATTIILMLLASAANAADWTVNVHFENKDLTLDSFAYCRHGCMASDYSNDTLSFSWLDGGDGTTSYEKIDYLEFRGRIDTARDYPTFITDIHLKDGKVIDSAHVQMSGVSGKRDGSNYTLLFYTKDGDAASRALHRITFTRQY
jgi:hypothetical protein